MAIVAMSKQVNTTMTRHNEPLVPPSKDWVNGLIAKMELVATEAGHIPTNERMEVQDLNRVLHLMDEARTKFLLICQLHGFNTKGAQDETQE